MMSKAQIRAALLAIPNRGSEENCTRKICGMTVERTGKNGWMILSMLRNLDSAVERLANPPVAFAQPSTRGK